MADESDDLNNVLKHVQKAFPQAEVKWISADQPDFAERVIRVKTGELDHRYLGFTSEAIDHVEDIIAHLEAHEWRERLAEWKQVLLGQDDWLQKRFMDV